MFVAETFRRAAPYTVIVTSKQSRLTWVNNIFASGKFCRKHASQSTANSVAIDRPLIKSDEILRTGRRSDQRCFRSGRRKYRKSTSAKQEHGSAAPSGQDHGKLPARQRHVEEDAQTGSDGARLSGDVTRRGRTSKGESEGQRRTPFGHRAQVRQR